MARHGTSPPLILPSPASFVAPFSAMATTAAAISSGYFGSVQGPPTRLAPATSGRNRLVLRCSASGGDGVGGLDPVLEEQKRRRAELSTRASFRSSSPRTARPPPLPRRPRPSPATPTATTSSECSGPRYLGTKPPKLSPSRQFRKRLNLRSKRCWF